jgi:16S rRNA (uracil1498-N3)-methyltransferase
MPERFFLDGDGVRDGAVVVTGPLAHHLARSLRMRAGDSVVIVDGSGSEHGVQLRSVSGNTVEGDVTWSRPATGEPRLRITAVQALPRERMEDCVDVLVENGAAEIRPVVTERVVSRPSADRMPQRLRRWQTVAAESAQLAGRGMIPRVHAPAGLDAALAALPAGARVLACTFDGDTSLAAIDVDPAVPLALCIGPEGGFGERDLVALRAAGAELVHLGARVLRTRYAGAVACAVVLAQSGDLAHPVAPLPPA